MPKSSLHYLSHDKLFSCNQGELIPIGVIEMLPGDKIQHSVSALVRTQPLLAPLYHKCRVYIRHYFVPSRILWDNGPPGS